jgi:hypothetical protein
MYRNLQEQSEIQSEISDKLTLSLKPFVGVTNHGWIDGEEPLGSCPRPWFSGTRWTSVASRAVVSSLSRGRQPQLAFPDILNHPAMSCY